MSAANRSERLTHLFSFLPVRVTAGPGARSTLESTGEALSSRAVMRACEMTAHALA